MSADLNGLARGLILLGGVLVVCGLVLLVAPKVPWIGRLPGDILIQRERVTFYFPLASCLLASVALSLIFWIIGRLR